jgi:hypothetical protein
MPLIYDQAEFYAALRIVVGADTPEIVSTVRRIAALRQDVERLEADLRAGRRTIKLPLTPPAGELQAHPHMIAASQAIEEHHLNAADARAVLRAQGMTFAMGGRAARPSAPRRP